MSTLVAIVKPLKNASVSSNVCSSPLIKFFIQEAKPYICPKKNNLVFEFYHHALFLLASPFRSPQLRHAHKSIICFAFAAENPIMHALAPLYFAASSPIDFANSVLSFLRLLHISEAELGTFSSKRLCISHVSSETIKEKLTSHSDIKIVGITSDNRTHLVGPNDSLTRFRCSLARQSTAHFIPDPVGYGALVDTKNLAHIFKLQKISIFSSTKTYESLHIFHPEEFIPVKIDQNFLLDYISFTLVPYDERCCVNALNTLDVDLIFNLFDADISKKCNVLQHVPRFIPPPVYSSVTEKFPIAVIGISCRTPGAENVDRFWQALCDGIDTHQTIPSRLYNIKDYQSPNNKEKNTMRTSHANNLERPGLFDPSLFGDSYEASALIDPQQRLGLMTAYEALQMAVIPEKIPEAQRAGVFISAASEDYRENISKPIKNGMYSNTFRSHISTRLSSYFGFYGPSVTYDTACSSGLVTIESACYYLVSRKCSIALAGGVNVLTNPQITIGLDRGFFLSPTGQCKTFDKEADGYCRSDAVGFVVLKRLDDALRDRDNILSVIASASTNHSGNTYSITHPHGPSQAQIYRSGLASASLVPSDISYVECHGAGTQAGDVEEIQGLLDVFACNGEHSDKKRKSDLIIGSVKANIGHSETCAGIISLIKTINVLRHKKVPTHAGIRTTINPKFTQNLGELGIKIPVSKDGAELPDNISVLCALVNNFSASGGNSSLVIKETPVQTTFKYNIPRYHLFVYSTQSPESLRQGLLRLREFIISHKSTILVQDICYTLTKGRIHHDLRVAHIVSSTEDIINFIDKSLGKISVVANSPRKSLYHTKECQNRVKSLDYGWVFTGQGSEWVGMGNSLYHFCSVFRESIDSIRRIALSFGFQDILPYILGLSNTASDFDSPVCTQLSIFAIEIALADVFRSSNLAGPSVVVGHSLGEYAALVVCGVIPLYDGIYLVGKRAKLVAELCAKKSSCMLAVQSDEFAILKFLLFLDQDASTMLGDGKFWTRVIEIACRNSPNDIVLAGPKPLIERLEKIIVSRLEVRCVVLDTTYAFHSAAIEPSIEPFSKVIEELSENTGLFKEQCILPKEIRLLSTVKGNVMNNTRIFEIDKQYFLQHARYSVNFSDAFNDLVSGNENVPMNWIEIGPHPTLTSVIKTCIPEVNVIPTMKKSTDSNLSILKLIETIFVHSSSYIDFNMISKALSWNEHSNYVHMPTYSFDQTEYWVNFSDRGLRPHLLKKVRSQIRNVKKVEASRNNVLPKQQPSSSKYPFLSKCIYFNEEKTTDKELKSILEIETSNYIIERAIMGHKIMGRGMTPGSIFSEIAFEAGEFMRELEDLPDKNKNSILSLVNVEITSSLLMDKSSTRPIIRVSVNGSFANEEARLTLIFSSRDPDEIQHVHHHAIYRVALVNPMALNGSWGKISHLVQRRSNQLIGNDKLEAQNDTDENNSIGDFVQKELIYSLFGKLIEYSSEHQGLRMAWISSDGMEATAKVEVNGDVYHTKGFTCNPFLLDSIGQISGFICNFAMVDAYNIYIANGVGSITFTRLMKESQNTFLSMKYSTYCKMTQSSNGQFAQGDVWIFRPHDGALYGLIENVRFKKVKEINYRKFMLSQPVSPAKNALTFQLLPRECTEVNKVLKFRK